MRKRTIVAIGAVGILAIAAALMAGFSDGGHGDWILGSLSEYRFR